MSPTQTDASGPTKGIADALRDLMRAYVGTLENARDRIIFLGGDCDSLDKMVSGDPALRAAREALEQPSEPVAVSGWVIEGAWSPIDTPDYWVGSSAWSPDPYKALRFATSKDAQQAADMMCSGLSVRLCEHEWAEQPETKVAVRQRWESTGLCGCTGELKNGERPFACEHGFKTELQNGGAGK